MKIRKITTAIAAAAAIGVVCAPLASADAAEPVTPTTTTLGSPAKLVDGDVVQAWTITDLKPSSDTIPHPVYGTLWEATATDEAIQGSVTPIVSNLNARTADGQTYRVLFGAATPQGVNPATLAQGEKTTGKVYFDVTGAPPTSVVYNAGGVDLAVWTPAPPSSGAAPSRSYPSSSYPSTGAATSAPAGTAAEAPEDTTAAPAATGAQVPETGSQGTPLPAGSQGTPATEDTAGAVPAAAPGAPAPEGSQGTPITPTEGAPTPDAPAPAGSQGTPQPASNQGAPQPAGSQGTPLPEGEQVPTPTTYLPTP